MKMLFQDPEYEHRMNSECVDADRLCLDDRGENMGKSVNGSMECRQAHKSGVFLDFSQWILRKLTMRDVVPEFLS